MPRRKGNKYGAVKVVTESGTFDSKLEYARWQFLSMLEKAGEIHGLEKQVRYDMLVNGYLICYLLADFRYSVEGEIVVEDTKSTPTKTRAYRIKFKLMKAIHGITIKEVHAANEDVR